MVISWNPHPRQPESDWVSLSKLRLQAVIGVYPHERLHPQPVDIDLAMQLNTRAAAVSLNLSQSIDYAKVARDLRLLLQGASFHLLETAAEAVAALLLAPFPDRARPEAVQVKLCKPSALDGLATPSVAIFRTREDFEFLPGELPGETRVFASADVRISLVDTGGERTLAITRCGDREFLTKPTQVFDFPSGFDSRSPGAVVASTDLVSPNLMTPEV